jgi:hypothetical protein
MQPRCLPDEGARGWTPRPVQDPVGSSELALKRLRRIRRLALEAIPLLQRRTIHGRPRDSSERARGTALTDRRRRPTLARRDRKWLT